MSWNLYKGLKQVSFHFNLSFISAPFILKTKQETVSGSKESYTTLLKKEAVPFSFIPISHPSFKTYHLIVLIIDSKMRFYILFHSFWLSEKSMFSYIEWICYCWYWYIPSNTLCPHLCFWRYFLLFNICIFMENCRLTESAFRRVGTISLGLLDPSLMDSLSSDYGKSKLGDLCKFCWESAAFPWADLSQPCDWNFPPLILLAPGHCHVFGFSSSPFRPLFSPQWHPLHLCQEHKQLSSSLLCEYTNPLLIRHLGIFTLFVILSNISLYVCANIFVW